MSLGTIATTFFRIPIAAPNSKKRFGFFRLSDSTSVTKTSLALSPFSNPSRQDSPGEISNWSNHTFSPLCLRASANERAQSASALEYEMKICRLSIFFPALVSLNACFELFEIRLYFIQLKKVPFFKKHRRSGPLLQL